MIMDWKSQNFKMWILPKLLQGLNEIQIKITIVWFVCECMCM